MFALCKHKYNLRMLAFCGDALEYISKYTVQEYFRLETKVAVERVDNMYIVHMWTTVSWTCCYCVYILL